MDVQSYSLDKIFTVTSIDMKCSKDLETDSILPRHMIVQITRVP